MRRALITGVTGQDGAYLARLLLEKGYEVFGASRGGDPWRLVELGIERQIRPLALDLSDGNSVRRAVEEAAPDEAYHLAAQTSVPRSFADPVLDGDVNALGPVRLLEALRGSRARFFHASTAALFGGGVGAPFSESSPFRPRNPYGASKLYAHSMVRIAREAHGTHASSGILFNHESPLRGTESVTRKITASLALIRHGALDALELGALDARRDWGFAPDYVEAMWRMAQADAPDDVVLATGRAPSVRDFAAAAGAAAGFDLDWDEGGATDCATGKRVVRTHAQHLRAAEADVLVGDATKARERLGWTPTMAFEGLVEAMVEADLDRAARGALSL